MAKKSGRRVTKPRSLRALERSAQKEVDGGQKGIGEEKVKSADSLNGVETTSEKRVEEEKVKSAGSLKGVKITSQKGAGGEKVKVAEKFDSENVFEGFTKLSESFFKPEGYKKFASWYIETSEKFATQLIELQEKATSWTKETPFAPLFEAQSSIARKLVERSHAAARNLWQLSVEQ